MDAFTLQETVRAVELPASSAMTAAEVLNWVAFGRPIRADLTLHESIERIWRISPSDLWQGKAMTMMLRLLADEEAGRFAPDQAPWPEVVWDDPKWVPPPLGPRGMKQLRAIDRSPGTGPAEGRALQLHRPPFWAVWAANS